MIKKLRVQVLAIAAGKVPYLELTFCADSYSVSIPPCVTGWYVKDPSYSAKSAGGKLTMKLEWADHAVLS